MKPAHTKNVTVLYFYSYCFIKVSNKKFWKFCKNWFSRVTSLIKINFAILNSFLRILQKDKWTRLLEG